MDVAGHALAFGTGQVQIIERQHRDAQALESISDGRFLLGVGTGGNLDSAVLGAEELSLRDRTARFMQLASTLLEREVSVTDTAARAEDTANRRTRAARSAGVSPGSTGTPASCRASSAASPRIGGSQRGCWPPTCRPTASPWRRAR